MNKINRLTLACATIRTSARSRCAGAGGCKMAMLGRITTRGMMKMRVKNAVLNWGTGGEVRVFDWTQGWPAVMFAQWVYLETPKRMLLEAMHAIIRDGVNPEDIHRELLRVSEYYDMCANDMPGITARDSIFSVGKS